MFSKSPIRSSNDRFRHAGAEFRLAMTLYDAGWEAEAEAACQHAIVKGLTGIAPQLFLARLFQNQGRLEEAEGALRKAVRHDPVSPQAQHELAQLVWMRTGDIIKARAELDAAPPTAMVTSITVKLLQWVGDDRGAAALAAARAEHDPSLQILAVRAAIPVDPEGAACRLAQAGSSGNGVARAKAEIETDLALGKAIDAARRAEILHRLRPNDHYATALLAAAWRLNGDLRHRALYDYDRLVKSYRIDPPRGWNDLPSYLADLAAALDDVHRRLTHPLGQSLRNGSQTLRDLRAYAHPAIRALFAALDAPIRRHIASLRTEEYWISGAWSVRLNREGFHVDHVHPEGWLSSALYVRVPEELEGQAGWLKFGEPGTPTRPRLGAEHFVKPEPGTLVLFPSYFWHGTVPFASDLTRLTCAFDIVPRLRTRAGDKTAIDRCPASKVPIAAHH